MQTKEERRAGMENVAVVNVGVVSFLKLILKSWQLHICLSFKLDVHRHLQLKDTDTCPGLPQTFLTIPEQKSQEVLGQLGTSRDVLPDMTTKVPGPKVSRSPGTTQDIPGCPTWLDYQSPCPKKDPKKSRVNSGRPGMSYQTRLLKSQFQKSQKVLEQLGTSQDVLPDMTTKVPGPKVPRSPGTTQDIPDVLPGLTTKVPCPKIPKCPGQLRTSWDVLPELGG